MDPTKTLLIRLPLFLLDSCVHNRTGMGVTVTLGNLILQNVLHLYRVYRTNISVVNNNGKKAQALDCVVLHSKMFLKTKLSKRFCTQPVTKLHKGECQKLFGTVVLQEVNFTMFLKRTNSPGTETSMFLNKDKVSQLHVHTQMCNRILCQIAYDITACDTRSYSSYLLC